MNADLPLALHRAIICVDVKGFGDQRRTNPHQIVVRDGLYRALRVSLDRSGVPWESCYNEDRGDGALVLVPAEVPKSVLVSNFVWELARALGEHNREHDRLAQIRLRLAMHAGEVHHDEYGVTGDALNATFRLLESETVKRALAESTGDLAVITSQWFFDEVIRHTPASFPERYQQVRVSVKETRVSAWICLPDESHSPQDAARMMAPLLIAPRPRTDMTGGRQVGGLPVPRQLPADTGVFVGRQTDLAALDAIAAGSEEPRTVIISAIAGGGGVGKTALAVHWAHRVRARFPDGDLFVDLRGYDSAQPVTPLQALDAFLRALDVPAEKIPTELGARAALFRSLLTGRRMLVVLDNAANTEQVRPLLPGTVGCLALITSRSRLSGLTVGEGAVRLPIDPLAPDQALNLLREIIGNARIDAELQRAVELTGHCGYLPLALRITAERVSSHPHLRLADLAEDLRDERNRLDALTTGDDETIAVRTVFSWSYGRLPSGLARAFRLLGLHNGPDLCVGAAAALIGSTIPHAHRLLDALTGHHLLEHIGRDRYRFHDLLRIYAAERAHLDEPQATRVAAISHMLNWYEHTAMSARRVLLPHGYEIPPNTADPASALSAFSNHDTALRWLEEERINLVAATHLATDIGQDATAWKLSYALSAYFAQHWYPDDWLDVLRVGLAAAQRLSDPTAHALMLIGVGERAWELGQFSRAIDHYLQALPIAQKASSRSSEGFCRNGLGTIYARLGRFEEAVENVEHSLTIFRDIGNRRGEGIGLTNLGSVYRRMGRMEDAIKCHRQAIMILTETGNHESLAGTLRRIGNAYHDLQEFRTAIKHYRQALTIFRSRRSRAQTARVLTDIGEAQSAAGQTAAARQSWQEALAILSDLKHPRAEDLSTKLRQLADTYEPGGDVI